MPDVTQTEVVQVRMPVDMLDRLREMARENERTIAAEVRMAIRGYLKDPAEAAA